jgi:hypothetical protein
VRHLYVDVFIGLVTTVAHRKLEMLIQLAEEANILEVII